MSRDTGLHASNVPKEGKSPPSDSRLDVLEACAVLHLQVCYVIEPADPYDASQAAHMERLQTIDIGLEQGPMGPCFSAVQEDRQDARLVQAEFCNKTSTVSKLDRADSWPMPQARYGA